MDTLEKILLVVGGGITLCFGVWHFFVPAAYKWFSYLSTIPDELKKAIEASNFFLSVVLVILGIETIYFVISDDYEIKMLMILMGVLWLARTVYQIIKPQGSLVPGLSVIMSVVFFSTSLCFIIPLILIGLK